MPEKVALFSQRQWAFVTCHLWVPFSPKGRLLPSQPSSRARSTSRDSGEQTQPGEHRSGPPPAAGSMPEVRAVVLPSDVQPSGLPDSRTHASKEQAKRVSLDTAGPICGRPRGTPPHVTDPRSLHTGTQGGIPNLLGADVLGRVPHQTCHDRDTAVPTATWCPTTLQRGTRSPPAQS